MPIADRTLSTVQAAAHGVGASRLADSRPVSCCFANHGPGTRANRAMDGRWTMVDGSAGRGACNQMKAVGSELNAEYCWGAETGGNRKGAKFACRELRAITLFSLPIHIF